MFEMRQNRNPFFTQIDNFLCFCFKFYRNKMKNKTKCGYSYTGILNERTRRKFKALAAAVDYVDDVMAAAAAAAAQHNDGSKTACC